MNRLSDMRMKDGSRHFGSLPDVASWYQVRDHIGRLPGAKLTGFLCDDVTEAWIDFTFRHHHFSINDQYGEYWFFVRNPACPDEILEEVLLHFEELLDESHSDNDLIKERLMQQPVRFRASYAARHGNLDELQQLFQEHESELREPDQMGSTLLHDACGGGNVNVIQWLMEQDFDINALDQSGGTPLFEAVYNRQEEAANLLRGKGARLKVPKGMIKISCFQLAISGMALVALILIIITGDYSGWKCIVAFFSFGVALLGAVEGIKGLQGRQTFANSA